jgi:hypothetical protein
VTSAPRPISAILFVLALSGLATLWTAARSGAGIDFYQSWVGARLARESGDFYAPATWSRAGEEYVRRAMTEEHSLRRLAVATNRRKLELVATPFLYLVHAPFTGTYERDLLLFHILSIAALLAAVVLLTRTFALGTPFGLALFAFLAIAFLPVATDLRVANVNQFVLLDVACAIALVSRRRFLACGAVLALAVLAKPYFAVVFPLTYAFWILQRRWRDIAAHAAGGAIVAAAGFAATTLYFRSGTIWLDWLRALANFPRSLVPLDKGNFALARIAEELWGVRPSAVLVAAAFALTVGVVWRAKGTPQHTDRLAIALAPVIALVGSPLVWVHYFVQCVPLIAYLLRPATELESIADIRRRQIAAAVALSIFAIEPWARVLPSTIQLAALVNVGLAIVFAAGLFDLRLPSAEETA